MTQHQIHNTSDEVQHLRHNAVQRAKHQSHNTSDEFWHISCNDLPHDFLCNIAIYADDATLYSKCDQASHLWQELELASELESDLQDTED